MSAKKSVADPGRKRGTVASKAVRSVAGSMMVDSPHRDGSRARAQSPAVIDISQASRVVIESTSIKLGQALKRLADK
jgi:hypothetical protein